MAAPKHWEVPTTFKVHGGKGEDAQRLVQGMEERMLTEADPSAGLVMVRVHRPGRLRGPSDKCALCKDE